MHLGKGGGMEQLNPLDAQFIDAEDEDRQTSFAIASIAVFEGPAPPYDEFLRAIEGRLPLVPLYRRKLRKVPFGLGPPVWVDDPNFDLRYHIRQTALPTPGGDEQLANLMARVMSQRLDRDYPLWEYWLVEGLSEGRWALISKGPSLHGRRGLRYRPVPGDLRYLSRAAAASSRRSLDPAGGAFPAVACRPGLPGYAPDPGAGSGRADRCRPVPSG